MNNLEFTLEMKNKRLASGLSQGELASLTHVSRYSINRFENGKANASKETQNVILRCLNYYVCDKHRQRGAYVSERLICHLFDNNAQDRAGYHCDNDADNRAKACVLHAEEHHICTYHDNVAVSEVQHFCDTVNHCVAKSNDRINASQAETVDQVIQKAHFLNPHSNVYFVLSFR